MSQALKRIASLHRSSEIEARAFCMAVQSYFKLVPSFAAIAVMVGKNPNATPEQLGQLGCPGYPSKLKTPKSSFPAAKSALLKKEPTKTQHSRLDDDSRRRRNAALVQGNRYENTFAETESEGPRVVRLSAESAPQCPHGIPTWRKCAICSPDEFRRNTGLG